MLQCRCWDSISYQSPALPVVDQCCNTIYLASTGMVKPVLQNQNLRVKDYCPNTSTAKKEKKENPCENTCMHPEKKKNCWKKFPHLGQTFWCESRLWRGTLRRAEQLSWPVVQLQGSASLFPPLSQMLNTRIIYKSWTDVMANCSALGLSFSVSATVT